MNTYSRNLSKINFPSIAALRNYLTRSRLLKKIKFFGFSHYCPLCRSNLRLFFTGTSGNKGTNVQCPVCGSMNRHRFAYLCLKSETNLFQAPMKRMLHIAPERSLGRLFKDCKFINYISGDLKQESMLQVDITNMYFPDETFDVIFISHVFEHIIEDQKAFKEVFRVLKHKGFAILISPIGGEVTIEGSSIRDEKERLRIIRQVDHVRIYGEDYYQKIEEAGFKVKKIRLQLQDDPSLSKRLGISPGGVIPYCIKE